MVELVAEVQSLQEPIDIAKYKGEIAQKVLETIDAFLADILAKESGQMSPLANAVLSEAYTATGATYVLYTAAVAAGGESIYERKVGTDKAHHLGGVSVAWLLANSSGLKSAGLLTKLGQVSTSIGDLPEVSQSLSIGPALEDTDPTQRRPATARNDRSVKCHHAPSHSCGT